VRGRKRRDRERGERVTESSIKKRISMVGKEYAVLKEDMKLDECGWS
jgi:hypothetical protein